MGWVAVRPSSLQACGCQFMLPTSTHVRPGRNLHQSAFDLPSQLPLMLLCPGITCHSTFESAAAAKAHVQLVAEPLVLRRLVAAFRLCVRPVARRRFRRPGAFCHVSRSQLAPSLPHAVLKALLPQVQRSPGTRSAAPPAAAGQAPAPAGHPSPQQTLQTPAPAVPSPAAAVAQVARCRPAAWAAGTAAAAEAAGTAGAAGAAGSGARHPQCPAAQEAGRSVNGPLVCKATRWMMQGTRSAECRTFSNAITPWLTSSSSSAVLLEGEGSEGSSCGCGWPPRCRLGAGGPCCCSAAAGP